MALAQRSEAREPREVPLRGADGASNGTVALAGEIFGVEPNIPLLHQVVTAQLAAARRGTQSTKTRAEVSGGGKKPFKQKGTGRARQGSERAPHFIGGGIALGPKPRSYRQRTPKKMVALALRSALSDRAAEGKVVVVERWPFESPSTKAARRALEALGLSGRVLVVLGAADDVARRSFRNLPEVQLLKDTELNAYDILVNDWVVFTRANLPGAAGEASAEAPVVEEVGGSDPAAKPDQANVDQATAEHAGPEEASTERALSPEGESPVAQPSDAQASDDRSPGDQSSDVESEGEDQ